MNIKKHTPSSKSVRKIFFDCFFNPLFSLIKKSSGGNDIAVSAIALGDENFNVAVPAAGETATITNAPNAISSALAAVKVNIAATANADIKIGNTPFIQGQTVDFSAPVTFTVTAQGGTTVKSYSVNIMPYNKDTNPYGIYTIKHLVNVANELTASYLLKNNIILPNADASDAATATGISDYASAGWLPLGAYSSAFTGTFDGGNFSINNFYLNREMENAGLFEALGTKGAIKNLGVNGVTTGTAATGISRSNNSQYTGILAGDNAGTIDKCYATGSVSSSSYDSDSFSHAGGLAEWNRGHISNSYATGNVSSSSSSSVSNAGGLAGYNYGSISNSYAAGSVSVSSFGYAGAFAGNIYSDTFTNCYCNSNVAIKKEGQAAAPDDAPIAGITAKTKAEMQTDPFKRNLNVSGNTWGRSEGKNDKLPYINGVGIGK